MNFSAKSASINGSNSPALPLSGTAVMRVMERHSGSSSATTLLFCFVKPFPNSFGMSQIGIIEVLPAWSTGGMHRAVCVEDGQDAAGSWHRIPGPALQP